MVSYVSLGTEFEANVMHVPLDSPLHGAVCDNKWWKDVKDLTADTSGGVEESGVKGTSEWALGVGGETVVDDTLLLWGSCKLRQPLIRAIDSVMVC